MVKSELIEEDGDCEPKQQAHSEVATQMSETQGHSHRVDTEDPKEEEVDGDCEPKQQAHSEVATQMSETQGHSHRVDTEDPKEEEVEEEENGNGDDDYKEEEGNDDGDDDYKEEEVEVSDEDDDEEEEEDNDDGEKEDEGNNENKRKFFLRNEDLELFNCAICHQRAATTVYLCENEHVACYGCGLSSECTACNPSTSYKRCRLLEKILESLGGESCKYLRYGCREIVTLGMEDCHEIGCKFVPCSCPIEGCNFCGPSTQLSTHLSGEHGDSVMRFRYSQLYSITLRCDQRFCVLQEINNGDVFLVNNIEHDIGNMVTVSRIGPYTSVSPFSVEIEIKANKWIDWDQLSVRCTSKIESIRSRVGHQPSIRDFLLVPSGYFEGQEEFKLLFCISRSDA